MVYARITGEATPTDGSPASGRCWELSKDYSSASAAAAGVAQLEPQIVAGGLKRFGVNVTFNNYGAPKYTSGAANCGTVKGFIGRPIDVQFSDFPGSNPATGLTAYAHLRFVLFLHDQINGPCPFSSSQPT